MLCVDITHKDDLAFEVKSEDNQFVIDAKAKGRGPLEMLLASLASCIGVYTRKYSEGSKLGLSNFSVRVEAELDKNRPIAFKTINISLGLKGASLDERRSKALLEFVKNCPIHSTLKGNPQIDIKLS